MEALRQFVSTIDGNLILKVPKEYQKRKLEIIILPADIDYEYDLDSADLIVAMENISKEALTNGLTPQILENILNEK